MTDNKVDYFDGIRDHFSALDTKVIEVPEWGLVGEKAIHCKPFNMMEKQKLQKPMEMFFSKAQTCHFQRRN